MLTKLILATILFLTIPVEAGNLWQPYVRPSACLLMGQSNATALGKVIDIDKPVIKYTVDGSYSWVWRDKYYPMFARPLILDQKQYYTFDCVIWWQGESDKNTSKLGYQYFLDGLNYNLKQDIGNYFGFYILQAYTENGAVNHIGATQKGWAIGHSHSTFVYTSQYERPDGIHVSTEGLNFLNDKLNKITK